MNSLKFEIAKYIVSSFLFMKNEKFKLKDLNLEDEDKSKIELSLYSISFIKDKDNLTFYLVNLFDDEYALFFSSRMEHLVGIRISLADSESLLYMQYNKIWNAVSLKEQILQLYSFHNLFDSGLLYQENKNFQEFYNKTIIEFLNL